MFIFKKVKQMQTMYQNNGGTGGDYKCINIVFICFKLLKIT